MFPGQMDLLIYDSNDNANELLELIHCDIWDAYRASSLCGAYYFLNIIDDANQGV